jgi:GWxTD domain-containing protein
MSDTTTSDTTASDTTWSVQRANAHLKAVLSNAAQPIDSHTEEAYLYLLEQMGRAGTRPEEAAILQRRFAQLVPLLSDATLADVVADASPRDASSWTFRAEAGERLLLWWRQRDRMPATPANERLVEHVQRLRFAQQNFSCADTRTGFDDRGTVYLRLGAPLERREVSFRNGEFIDGVFRFGVNVSMGDFPLVSFWRYTNRQRSGYFLFVEQANACFRIGTADDVLPATLRRPQSNTQRGINRAYSAMVAMRFVYRELALLHPDFQSRYSDVVSYAQWQEAKQNQVAAARSLSSAGGEVRPGALDTEKGTQQVQIGGGRYVFWNTLRGISPPNQFMQRTLTQSRQEDEATAQQRASLLPREQSSVETNYRSLPVAFRPVRFLTPEGRTQVELSWGMHSSALAPDDEEERSARDPVFLAVDGVRYDAAYRAAARNRLRYLMRPSEQQGVFLSQPLLFEAGPTAPFHLGVQWSGYKTRQAEGDSARIGAQEWLSTARIDSLAPLPNDPAQLVLSDLRPMIPRSGGVPVSVDGFAAYPFDTFTTGSRLALYFEVYHLVFDADDVATYTVEYRVEGEGSRSRLGRLFRGDDARSTTVTTTNTTQSRRAEEYILLDLADWEEDSEADITVTVRLTDETSGQSVERAIDLRLVPEEE